MVRMTDIIMEELRCSLSAVEDAELEKFACRISSASKIFCDGLGRSGLAMKRFAMRLKQLGLECYVVGETTTPASSKGDLLILCTASGSSPVLEYHVDCAKKSGSDVYLLTAAKESGLSKISDAVIYIPAPNKDDLQAERRSVQPMGTRFEQAADVLCDIACLFIMEQMGITEETMRRNHANIE